MSHTPMWICEDKDVPVCTRCCSKPAEYFTPVFPIHAQCNTGQPGDEGHLRACMDHCVNNFLLCDQCYDQLKEVKEWN